MIQTQEAFHTNQYLPSAASHLRPASPNKFLVLYKGTGVSGAEL
jgi:hypothetical protein